MAITNESIYLNGQLSDDNNLDGGLSDGEKLSGELSQPSSLSGRLSDPIVMSGVMGEPIPDEHILSGQLSEPLQMLRGTLLNPECLVGRLSNEALRGYSAYEIAVLAGYTGTEEEWLDSLHGERLEIRNNDGIIEYKYENQHMWTILIDLSSYTNDYDKLINRPSLDGTVLTGNRDLTEKYVLSMNAITNSELEEMLK